MKITKYGHACLFLENENGKVVIDPGGFTELPSELEDIKVVIVTEDHYDHRDTLNLKKILEQSPDATIFTTQSAGELLLKDGISHVVVEGDQAITESGFALTLSEGDHAIVHEILPNRVITVGVDDVLYYASDSWISPTKPYTVLALPTSGPWHKLTESVDFANSIDAKFVLATHNALLSDAGQGVANHLTSVNIKDDGKEWLYLMEGESKEF